jgi:hypothetical protein
MLGSSTALRGKLMGMEWEKSGQTVGNSLKVIAYTVPISSTIDLSYFLPHQQRFHHSSQDILTHL